MMYMGIRYFAFYLDLYETILYYTYSILIQYLYYSYTYIQLKGYQFYILLLLLSGFIASYFSSEASVLNFIYYHILLQSTFAFSLIHAK